MDMKTPATGDFFHKVERDLSLASIFTEELIKGGDAAQQRPQPSVSRLAEHRAPSAGVTASQLGLRAATRPRFGAVPWFISC